MKKIYSIIASVAVGLSALTASAGGPGWEKVNDMYAPYSVFVTSGGRILAGDFDYDLNGSGIYYSDDQGDTWQPAQIMKNCMWNYFLEAGDYIFAAGLARPSIARSSDGGKTWMILSYKSVINEFVEKYSEKGEEVEVGAVDMAFDPERNRIYAAFQDFGIGVIYSDDWGQTWNLTDRQSQMMNIWGNTDIEWYGGLEFFNGKLYAMGMLRWHVYDADKNKWSLVKRGNSLLNSNFLNVYTVHDGVLYSTSAQERSVVLNNDNTLTFPEFITTTTDGEKNWSCTSWPATEWYGYVRSIHHDGTRLFATVKNKTGWYSEDNGQTWKNMGKGYPSGALFTMLASDDDYLYGAGYSFGDPKADGIYRIAKATLNQAAVETKLPEWWPADGIDEVESFGPAVTIDGDVLAVEWVGPCVIEVYTAAGAAAKRVAGKNSMNISELPAGAYIYNVSVAGYTFNGKFVK